MSSYNQILNEQAKKLGFSGLSQALEAGCTVGGDCDEPRLIEPLTAAHEAWAKEKAEKLSILQSIKEEIINDYGTDCALVGDLEGVYDWIEKEAHD